MPVGNHNYGHAHARRAAQPAHVSTKPQTPATLQVHDTVHNMTRGYTRHYITPGQLQVQVGGPEQVPRPLQFPGHEVVARKG